MKDVLEGAAISTAIIIGFAVIIYLFTLAGPHGLVVLVGVLGALLVLNMLWQGVAWLIRRARG